jgi:hypothetical protein
MFLSTRVRQRLRTVFVCFVLEFGALIGLPMKPEEIEELMHMMNQPKIAQTTPDDESNPGDDGPDRPD